SFTQPLLYRRIAKHPLISTTYTNRLIAEGTITAEDSEAIKAEYTAAMDRAFEKAKAVDAARVAAGEKLDQFRGSTAIFQPGYSHEPVPTGVTADVLGQVARGLTSTPEGFHLNSKIKRFLDTRAKAHAEGGPIDWAF